MNVSQTILKCALRSLLALPLMAVIALAQAGGFSIQISSEPTEAGVKAFWVKAEVPGKGTRYRVRIGRFGNLSEAKEFAERTRSRGLIKEFILTNYEAPSGGAQPLKEAKAPRKPKQDDQAKVEKKSLDEKSSSGLESSNSETVAAKPKSTDIKEAPKNGNTAKPKPESEDNKENSYTFSELIKPSTIESP
jgi:hypothetical protein